MRVLCVCVCLSVCLSPTRCHERNVSPRYIRQRKEILLASCTNYFSNPIWCVVQDDKSLEVFNRLQVGGCARTLDFHVLWSGWILPTTWIPLEHSQRLRVEGHNLHRYLQSMNNWLNSTGSWLHDKNQPVRERVTMSSYLIIVLCTFQETKEERECKYKK